MHHGPAGPCPATRSHSFCYLCCATRVFIAEGPRREAYMCTHGGQVPEAPRVPPGVVPKVPTALCLHPWWPVLKFSRAEGVVALPVPEGRLRAESLGPACLSRAGRECRASASAL